MGAKWVHRILEKDASTMVGVCSFCGPVKLKRKRTNLACGNSEKRWTGDNNWNKTLNGRYKRLKDNAESKGLGFNINPELHALLLSRVCEYCLGPLNPTGSGLDRKDSNAGYTSDNVVPCCRECNQVKSNILSHEEMKAAMVAILQIRARKTPQLNA